MVHSTFRYADAVLRVDATERADLEWLAEFLAPGFELLAEGSDGPAPLARLEIVVDGARHAALLASAPADAAPQPFLSLDTETVHLPSWSADGRRLYRDDDRGVVFVESAERLVLVAPPDARGHRLAAMRVLRELAAQAHRRRPGRLPLHAAALELAGEGWLLAGPKNAGKTTLLMHLLSGHGRAQAGGARLISNDRVFVELDGAGTGVRGMPTAVSLRPGTLRRFPALRRDVPDMRSVTQHTLSELSALAPDIPPHPDDRRLRASPALVCERLGVGAVAAAPLDVVLLPRVDGGVAGWRLERLDAAEAAARLGACRYGAGADAGRTRLDRRLAGEAVDDLRAACDEVARRVPVFDCRLGPEAYDAPDAARELCRDVRETVA